MLKKLIHSSLIASTLLGSTLALQGCSDDSPEPANISAHTEATKPIVYAVNFPLFDLTRQLAGDAIEAKLPEMDGDPAFWNPDADDIINFQQASLVVFNGADYSKWRKNVTLDRNKQITAGQSFSDKLIYTEGPTHSHGPGEEHSHAGTAFTTWLDMQNAISMVTELSKSLSSLIPKDSATIAANEKALIERLSNYDKRLKAIGEKLAGEPILYSHPIYQYFQRAYDINGVAVTWEPDSHPSEELWSELTGKLKKHPAKVMLWEGEPLPETKAKLAELGVATIVFSQWPNEALDADFMALMETNIKTLEEYLSAKS